MTSVYNPGSSYALGARVTATYEFNNGFGLSATAGARRFSDEVARSPIVRSRYESVVYTGISYKFYILDVKFKRENERIYKF